MSTIYTGLAGLYDEWNREIDYETWADAIEKVLRERLPEASVLLDLGCGTGSMTIPLAKRGYDLVGIDLSPEMLSLATERAERAGISEKIQWTMQDMREFELPGKADAAISTLDCFNHLGDVDSLRAVFARLNEYLNEGGLVFFDLNSKYQFETMFADEVYTMETDTSFCVWQNRYRKKTRKCDFFITLFEKSKDGTYRRFDEVQTERYYPMKTVESILSAAGFDLIGVYGGICGEHVTDTDPRWYFLARKRSDKDGI